MMLYQVGEVQSVDAVSDNKVNRFNGTGVGIYATSYAQKSNAEARFDSFEYEWLIHKRDYISNGVFGDWIDLGHTRFPENFMLKASKARQLVLTVCMNWVFVMSQMAFR